MTAQELLDALSADEREKLLGRLAMEVMPRLDAEISANVRALGGAGSSTSCLFCGVAYYPPLAAPDMPVIPLSQRILCTACQGEVANVRSTIVWARELRYAAQTLGQAFDSFWSTLRR